jgi:hypothetical protein
MGLPGLSPLETGYERKKESKSLVGYPIYNAVSTADVM